MGTERLQRNARGVMSARICSATRGERGAAMGRGCGGHAAFVDSEGGSVGPWKRP